MALTADGRRCLLVPLTSEKVRPDGRSRGVALGERQLEIGGQVRSFLELSCKDDRLNLVFERLVDDVLVRLHEAGQDPVRVAIGALDEWRELLRTARAGLDREHLLGLVGELEILRMLAESAPELALAAWAGPSGAMHDFVSEQRALEVKATSSVDGNTVRISNLDQLDPAPVDDLLLAVVHVRESVSGPTLDLRLDELVDMGMPRDELFERVAEAGYVYESGAALPKFETRSVRLWHVSDEFPGLRRSRVNEQTLRGVSRVSYELSLDSLPRRLSDQVSEQTLRHWVA